MNQFVSRISKINNFVDRHAGSLFEPCGAKRLNAICTEAKHCHPYRSIRVLWVIQEHMF